MTYLRRPNPRHRAECAAALGLIVLIFYSRKQQIMTKLGDQLLDALDIDAPTWPLLDDEPTPLRLTAGGLPGSAGTGRTTNPATEVLSP